MNEIKIFDNPEFGEVRTVMIEGEPWFVGNDISQSLGYSSPKNAVAKFVDDEDKLRHQFDSSGQKREMIVINESGLYSLIFGSKLESAKKFKKWVTSEVLPSLRKTGSYALSAIPATTDGKIALLAQGHVELKQEVDNLRGDFETFKNDMPILGVEESRIISAVHKAGVHVLGGKDSNAYHNKSLRGKVYADIHKQLKREFGISTYKAIKRNQIDIAVGIIEAYKPPLVLVESIQTENAQESLAI